MTDSNTTPENPAASATNPQASPPGRQCGRHGHGRRRWFAVGLALLIGLAGFGIGRATGHSSHWRASGFGMNRTINVDTATRRADAGIGRMLSAVDGTPEQKAKIGDIAKAAIRDLIPLRDRLTGARDKLAVALKADTLDRAAIELLRAEQLVLVETASKRVLQTLTDAAEVLSPAQRAKLVDRWQSHFRRS